MKLDRLSQALVVLIAAALATIQMRLLQMGTDLSKGLDWDLHQTWNNWAGFRTRLFAPFVIHLLGGDLRAYLIFIFVGLVIGGILAYRLAGWTGMGFYHAGYALLASPWFSTWDVLSPVVFTVVVVLILEEWSWPWFMAIFIVGILNRPSADFIAVYMILSPKLRIPGIACVGIALAVHLYLEHTGSPHIGLNSIGQGLPGYSYRTDYFDLRPLNGILYLSWFLVAVYFVIITSAVAVIRQGYVALGVMYLLIFATITLLTGIVTESRIWLDFIPLIILAGREGGPPYHST
jgi:hypothetical protein